LGLGATQGEMNSLDGLGLGHWAREGGVENVRAMQLSHVRAKRGIDVRVVLSLLAGPSQSSSVVQV
jgi:hypothetical protein